MLDGPSRVEKWDRGPARVSCPSESERTIRGFAGNAVAPGTSPVSRSDESLVPLFIPALVTILLNRERAKGSPLTEEEVLEIRDASTVVMAPLSTIPAMIKSRGYEDIDPEQCWEHWKIARQQLAEVATKDTSEGGAESA